MQKQMKIEIDGREIEFTLEVTNSSESGNTEIFATCVEAIRKKFKVKEQMYVLGRYTQGDRDNTEIWVQVGQTQIQESEVDTYRPQLKAAKRLMTQLGANNPIIHYEFFPTKS